MEESVFFPSPNWYLTSVLKATTDGWLIYGSPAKGICVLSPVVSPSELSASQSFKVRTIHNAHKERVLDVSVSPSWPSSRLFVTSSEDGFVKQWNADDLNLLLAHNVHSTNKEPVAGLTYCDDNTVVSAGREGSIVVWDVQVNVTRNLTMLLKGLKPNCLSSSPHNPTTIAIGTKQGVVIVCSINDGGRMLYKVRGHDAEILKLSWCPCPISYIEKANNKRLESLKSKKKEEENDINEKEHGEMSKKKPVGKGKVFSVADRLKITIEQDFTEIASDTAECSDESSQSIVQEEDLFDVYKDPVDQEFGHTKFKSEDIVVADEKTEVKSDFLVECQRLKQELLKRKEEETSTNADVDNLSNQLQSTVLNTPSTEELTDIHDDKKTENWRSGQECELGVKQYKNMLASCCKSGKVCVWSMGKQVAFALPPGHQGAGNTARRNKMAWCAMHWLSADTLLLSDTMHRLLEYKTNKVGRNNQFSWQVLHEEHRRGLFCIASDAPRVQTADEDQSPRTIWSLAQDRFLVSYSYPENKVLAKYPTFGGFVYHMTSSPNDPSKLAICAGDGSVKIWEMELDSSNKLVVSAGSVTQHWQNIQGKVLFAAWHPTKENLLAYGTMEGRIGLLDTGKQERAAKLLYPAMAKGVYSLSWGEQDQLYACGSHQLYRYNTRQPNAEPELVSVKYDNKEWKVTEVIWSQRYLTVGSADGDVALLTAAAPHHLLTAAFPLRKAIQCICWHPAAVSSADGPSPHSDWLAVSSSDTDIALLQVVHTPGLNDGEIRLELVRTFVGHSDNVSKLAWSPHHEARLLSVAMDGVAQVWDAESGTVTSSFSGHAGSAGVLAGAWWPDVEHPDTVMTAGSDYSIRMWNTAAHPPSQLPLLTKTQKKRAKIAKPHTKNDALLAKTNGSSRSNHQHKKDEKPSDELNSDTELPDKMATSKGESKVSKRYIMPMTSKQQSKSPADGCRMLLHRYMLHHNLAGESDPAPERLDLLYDVDYLKLFGTREDVLQLIKMEQERHLDTMCLDGWLALTLLTGETESAIKLAASRHLLTPFLLSLAPAVSHRFWKEMMATYVVQIEKIEESGKNPGALSLGGAVVRAALVQLSLGNTEAAVHSLVQARLWREALAVARVRGVMHAPLLAQWAAECAQHGQLLDAALIYIAQEDFNNAITVLRKSKEQSHTDLAVNIAKLTGQHIYAQTLQQTFNKQQK